MVESKLSRPSASRVQMRRHTPGNESTPAPEPIVVAAAEAPETPQRSDAIRGGVVNGRLVRRRPKTEDKFYIPTNIIPAGWSYEWKRASCYGQPDTDHQTNLRENHWTPVPASRHPFMMPLGCSGPIEKDGMVLMERPQYLTDDAREEDYRYAMGEVAATTAQLSNTPGGHFTRNHPSVERIAKVRHSYGPINAES